MATFNWSGGRSHPLGCRKRGKRGFRTWRLQREKIICRWIIGISENLCINFFKYRHFRHLSSFLFPFLTLLFVFCYLPPPWITLVFSGEVYSWHLIRFLPGGDVIFRIIQSHFFSRFSICCFFVSWVVMMVRFFTAPYAAARGLLNTLCSENNHQITVPGFLYFEMCYGELWYLIYVLSIGSCRYFDVGN